MGGKGGEESGISYGRAVAKIVCPFSLFWGDWGDTLVQYAACHVGFFPFREEEPVA